MSETAAAAHEALMQFLYHAPIGLVETTLDGEITMINPMSSQLLMPLAAGGGMDNLFALLLASAPQLRELAHAAPYPGGTVCEDLRVSLECHGAGHGTSDGAPKTLSLRVLRLDANTLMVSVSDISTAVRGERQRVAAEVRDASRIDALTSMPNRSVVLERVEQALERSRRDPDHDFAVLFINGDRFNRVNVTLGPAAGDELLRLMAARVNGAVRLRDAVGAGLAAGQGAGGGAAGGANANAGIGTAGDAGDLASAGQQTAGRLGVDEFVVVLDGVRGREGAAAAAQRLVDALGKPYSIAGATVHSTASVGVSMGHHDAPDADAVLQDASLAMREAKRSGGARYCVFEPLMKERAWRRASLEGELRLALQEGQLFVVFQPITHLADGSVAGFEALVRWQHPLRGVVSPIEFIEIAEETGLIATLGAQVLHTACHQLAAWQRELGARAPQLMSVNLSRAQIIEPTLVAEVQQALRASGIAPACLQLEITESLAAENPIIQARLHELKALGVMLALDDFGTGYSSLASLHQWPVDVIKIDRSFVSQIDTSAHHRVLVEATVCVARSLGMGTVAEGVETASQAQMLKALNCDKGQGYLYARPLPVIEATQWLVARLPRG